jgi:hypothetical protein
LQLQPENGAAAGFFDFLPAPPIYRLTFTDA